MKYHHTQLIQYLCAVVLIVSSIILAYLQVLAIADVANGTLMYIAQAFLLAGSIFGLQYYVRKLNLFINEKNATDTARHPQQ